MEKKIKFLLLISLMFVLLIGVKVYAENPFTIENKSLKHEGTVLDFYGFINKLATEAYGPTSTARKNFMDIKRKDLKGVNLDFDGSGRDYLKYYRRQTCLDDAQADRVAEGSYRINDIIDIEYDKDSKCFVAVRADGKKIKASSNDDIKGKIARLIAITYINGKYTTDDRTEQISPLQFLLKIAWFNFSVSADNGDFVNGRFWQYYSIGTDILNDEYNFSRLTNGQSIKDELKNIVEKLCNFRQISKINVKKGNDKITAQENICSIKKDGYSTIGPFCLNFNDENGVEEIHIKNDSDNGTYKNITDDVFVYVEGSNDGFKSFKENKKIIGNNETFYLAVNNNVYTNLSITGNNEYKIKFKQEALKYYKTRIVLLENGVFTQQLGTFIEDSEETSFIGEAEYIITHKEIGKKIIIKKVGKQYDTNITIPLKGVKLKVYGNSRDKRGWIKANGDNIVEFTSDYNEATSWETDEKGIANIEHLPEETDDDVTKKISYFIYETEAIEGYGLEEQRKRYPNESDGLEFADEYNCVYLGETKGIEEWDEYQMIIEQYPSARLTIEKINSEDESEKIPGVKLKIYADLKDKGKGWLTTDGLLSYYNDSRTLWTTDDNGRINIDNTKEGTYYVYEIGAGTGYELEDQRNHYPDEKEDSESLGFSVAGKEEYDNAVYLEKIEIKEQDLEEGVYQFINPIEQYDDEPAKLTIRKLDYYDATKKLNGIEFAIFVGNSGWLGYENNNVTFGNDWSKAYRFKTGTAYCGENQVDGEFTLTGLEYGDYYVLEVSTGENDEYLLIEQPGYKNDSNYDFLTEDKWKMIEDGNSIESVLIGSESYNQKYTLVEKSNGNLYNFVRNRQDGQCDYIHLDWYKSRIFSDSRESYNYGTNHATYTIINRNYPDITIVKKDADTGRTLKGAEFEMYAFIDFNNGEGLNTYYVKPEIDANGDLRATYVTDDKDDPQRFEKRRIKIEDGEITIKGLLDAQYYLKETKAPEGYRLDLQKNYRPGIDENHGYVNCGIITVKEGKIEPPEKENDEYKSLQYNYGEGKYEITVENEGFIDIKGYVWEDNPDTKLDSRDNVYKENTNDMLYQSGMTVNLYKYNEQYTASTLLATTKTFTQEDVANDSEKQIGHYEFLQLLKQDELPYCYVEFVYDNTKYICVDPFAGNEQAINSKAQEYTMKQEELEDSKLTGETGSLPGRAITSPADEGGRSYGHKLTDYLNLDTATVENVNLGITQKLEPDFSITEDVAYMKIKFGTDLYKYKYMEENEQLERTMAPTVNQQVSKRTFTGKIYPSDVAYNMATGTETLQVYIVYRINIFNNTPHNFKDNYFEEKMYVESLTNTYDVEKYKLSNYTNSQIDPQEVQNDLSNNLWKSKNGSNVATYDCGRSWRDGYKNGVKTEFDENGNIIDGHEGYITTYIQFELTKEFKEKILEKKLTEGNLEEAPSQATASTFHEYLREDNVWKNGDNQYYEGHKQPNYNINERQYLHKSKSMQRETSELGMRFGLPENERTISGIVFEDTITDENKLNKKALGNGVKDTEEKTVSNVTVGLYELDTGNLATLYHKPRTENEKCWTENATMKVGKNGRFEFKGVIPGKYYVQFTYGNGSQKLYDTSGNPVKKKDKDGNDTDQDVEVTLSDYKSTIIDSSTSDGMKIREAMESSKNDKSKMEWYKDINVDNNYSTAVDDLEERKKADDYIYYRDKKSYDENGTKSTPGESIDAYTPKFLVTIENDKDSERKSSDAENYNYNGSESKINRNFYDYSGFNFGIITAPDITITPEKTIKNIKLGAQDGSNLISANPKDKAKYLKALNELSTKAEIEIDSNLLYGSALTVTYDLSLKNESTYTDYVENEGNSFGNYYKYGDSTNAHEKEVTVVEVIDTLDNDFNYKFLPDKLKQYKYEAGNSTSTESGEVIVNKVNNKEWTDEDGTKKNMETKCIELKGWTGIKKDEKVSIEYEAIAQLSPDAENLFENNAMITKIKLAKLTTLTSGSIYHSKVSTELTIIPPTGENRSYEVFILPCVILIVAGVGIVLIKKYVL